MKSLNKLIDFEEIFVNVRKKEIKNYFCVNVNYINKKEKNILNTILNLACVENIVIFCMKMQKIKFTTNMRKHIILKHDR